MAEDWNPEVDASSELLDSLPPEILETLTPEQRSALWGIAKPTSWRRHPIDIRISIPLLGGRLFMTVVSGLEHRGRGRRFRDSRMHPLFTFSNFLFLLLVFVLAVALGAVFTDVVNWLVAHLGLSPPSAEGVLAPR